MYKVSRVSCIKHPCSVSAHQEYPVSIHQDQDHPVSSDSEYPGHSVYSMELPRGLGLKK